MPVTTTRRDAVRATGSSDELPGADGRGAVDVAGEAARGDRVGGGEDVVLGAPDLDGHGGARALLVLVVVIRSVDAGAAVTPLVRSPIVTSAHEAVGSPSKT